MNKRKTLVVATAVILSFGVAATGALAKRPGPGLFQSYGDKKPTKIEATKSESSVARRPLCPGVPDLGGGGGGRGRAMLASTPIKTHGRTSGLT